MLLLKLFHKSLEPLWQFRRKKILVLASQRVPEDEGYLFLGEV